jgi:hypothetical protein
MWFDHLFSGTYKHTCKDGTVRFIHRNVDKAFPLALKEQQKRFNADLNVQRKASAKLHSTHTEKIQGLLFNISDQNENLMMTLRSAYIGFQSNPCGGDGFFQRYIERVNQEHHRLMQLKTQITGLIAIAKECPNNSEKILSMYLDIVGKISGKEIAEAAVAEIEANRNIAIKWTGGNDE